MVECPQRVLDAAAAGAVEDRAGCAQGGVLLPWRAGFSAAGAMEGRSAFTWAARLFHSAFRSQLLSKPGAPRVHCGGILLELLELLFCTS